MIYLDLFFGFLRVGMFAFGGAYSAIPLISDIVMSYGWLTEDQLTYMIAVSESTPGPIMVNLATFVGSEQAGLLGSLIATTAVVLPSFIIILIITFSLKGFIKNPYVQAVLRGLKPCIVGIILATGISMTVSALLPASGSIDIRAVILTSVFAALKFGAKPLFKKELSPIALILISAVCGIIVY